jgi:hypothetical protein
MARPPRASIGGLVYHVLNRANARMQIFECDSDYEAFEAVLSHVHARVPMRTASYCLMLIFLCIAGCESKASNQKSLPAALGEGALGSALMLGIDACK